MSKLNSRWSRLHMVLMITIFGMSGGQENAIDLEQLKNEVQILHKLTDKLEEDIQSYERDQTRHSSHENVKNVSTNASASIGSAGPTQMRPLSTSQPNEKQMQNENRALNKHHWPTFNELLMLANRKYDWQNDKWIRLKAKRDPTKTNQIPSSDVHHVDIKDKFRFKTLRYDHNSNKHYIIAVSAIGS